MVAHDAFDVLDCREVHTALSFYQKIGETSQLSMDFFGQAGQAWLLPDRGNYVILIIPVVHDRVLQLPAIVCSTINYGEFDHSPQTVVTVEL